MIRLTRVGIVVVAIAPVVLGVVAFLAVERQTYVGATAIVKITENAGKVSAEDAFTAVSDSAQRGRYDVAREVVDLRSPETERHLFAAVGRPDGPRARWLVDGYPDLSGQVSTSVAPLSTIGTTDPRGYYFVFGTADDGQDLERRLAAIGLTGSLITQPTALGGLGLLLPAPTLALFGSTALGVFTLGFAGAALRERERAVARAHGGGLLSVLRRDVRRVRWWALCVPATWAALGVAYSTRGWPQWEVLVPLSATLAVAGVGLLVTGHVGATALGFSEAIVPAMNGRRPSRWSARSIGLVRLPALALLAATLSTGVASSAQLHGFRTSDETRAAAGSAVAVGISGSLGSSELTDGPESVWERFGVWAQRAEDNGELIVTASFGLRELGPWSGRDVPVVFVNDRYLRDQGVTGVLAPATGVRILIPDRSSLDESEVGPLLVEAAELKLGIDAAEATVARAVTPRRAFTYATPGRVAPNWVDDPVLVVVSSTVLRRIENRVALSSWLSTGDVVLADDRWARASIEANGLTDAVLSVQLVAQAAADAERRLAQESAIGWTAAALALAIVALSSWTSVSARIARTRRRSFVQQASGWSFLRSRRRAVLSECALVGFVCLVAWSERAALAPDVEGLNLELDPVVAHATTAFVITIAGATVLGGAAIALEWAEHRRIPSVIRKELG